MSKPLRILSVGGSGQKEAHQDHKIHLADLSQLSAKKVVLTRKWTLRYSCEVVFLAAVQTCTKRLMR